MSNTAIKDLFLASLERCAASEDFIPSFYQRFLSSSEEIQQKFSNTDFEHQNIMLLRSLRLSGSATSGDPKALEEIRERAETHDRYHLDIKPELYDYWLDAVLKTASETDPQWDSDIDHAWQSTLHHVINQMKKHY